MKSTIWSKIWSTFGVVSFAAGLAVGLSTTFFLVTSVSTTVTVSDAITMNRGGNDRFSYIFEATDAQGRQHNHESNMFVSWPMHAVGDVVDGRVSAVSGRVLSQRMIATHWSLAAWTLALGAYLGRRVIFIPLGYCSGRLVGFLLKVVSKFRRRA